MQCDTMRQGTGSGSKTSPSSPTRLFFPTASCLSPTASSSKKLKRRGQTDLTFLTAVTSTASSIHTNSISTFPRYDTCNHSHPPNKCSAQGKECFNCGSQNHYTALYRCQRHQWPTHHARSSKHTGRSPKRDTRSRYTPDDRHMSS